MAFQKLRFEEFHPYIVERDDLLNWVVSEMVEGTSKKGEPIVSQKRLYYCASFTSALQEVMTAMADSIHVTTMQEYVEEIKKASSAIVERVATLEPIGKPLVVRRKRKSAKQEQPAPAPTILLEEE